MTAEVVWTADRILAVVAGGAFSVFLWVFFFGKRRQAKAVESRGAQSVEIVVAGGYNPDVVVARKGMPLTIVFDRRESSPCSDEVILAEFKIRRALPAHERTSIQILPGRAGEFPFSCGMNMLHGKIKVID